MTDKDEEIKLNLQKEKNIPIEESSSFPRPYGFPPSKILKRTPMEEEIIRLQKNLMSPSFLEWYRFWYPIDREEDLRKLLKKARSFDKMLKEPRKRIEKALKEKEIELMAKRI